MLDTDSLSFIDVVFNVNKSQCQAQILTRVLNTSLLLKIKIFIGVTLLHGEVINVKLVFSSC